ncbi:hypothetical protein [Pseudomonas granadensis]|uniref:hypothetical protein n=1 Tax=Pseudomonas granadensis TaxID=1421430 RepID=UPI00300E6EE8
MIKTIPTWQMMMLTRGKIVGLVILGFLPAFIIGGAWIFLEGLQSGQTRKAAMGLICMIFFGLGILLLAPSKQYVPGKTFQAYRNKKLHTQKAVKYGYAIIVLFCAIFAILVPEQMLKALGYGVVGIIGIYTYSKSLKFHADIDYSTNEYLTTSLGFAPGEKILVSYQNFEAGEVYAGSNAFAATATKLIAASFDGDQWIKLSRDMNQISRIGIIGDENQNYFVKLQFNDGADALLCVGLFEKLTSSPALIIKKLLEAIDTSLLGAGGASKTAQRRRVVVNSDTAALPSENVVPQAPLASSAPTRNIEVPSSVLDATKGAEDASPGRRLEL